MCSKRETVNVEERQDVDHDVVRRDPPRCLQRSDAGSEVGMRMHDPLGPSGRARAVNHQARAVAADFWLGKRARRGIPDRGVIQHGVKIGQIGLQ